MVNDTQVTGPLQIKGSAKRTGGSTAKKNSKLAKFENDADTVSVLGPIPPPGSQLFEGMHFLLTCADTPRKTSTGVKTEKVILRRRHPSWEAAAAWRSRFTPSI
ncbi:hypothetical protein EVAR_9374_1 [Eumeta japonica]|uniref:Uncharacterized protein n=1 Tax=Eumeta variegata TaxID=151549 RepID=A0A4C1SCD1_EUMVA|nr:hypothetical protein EVAR_9374_1 [Eumeta japonica]